MTKKTAQEGTRGAPGNLHVPEDCRAISQVLARVGDKWTVLVVSNLGDGPKRFNELRKALGSISQRMLTLTLRGLERDGLVTRTAYPTIPPRVDYELTKLGRSLLEPVNGLEPVGAQAPCGDGRRPRPGSTARKRRNKKWPGMSRPFSSDHFRKFTPPPRAADRSPRAWRRRT